MRSKTLTIGAIGVVIGLLLAAAGIVVAGSLNPAAGPAGAGSQMFTLQQIYDRLNTGAAGSKMTAFTEPSSGPGAGTMRTLDEIYDLIEQRAPVPKTGQTTSYAAGDDGALQKGVAWPSPRFTDNGNGTVTDNLTGLVWLKNANCYGPQTWANALSEANTLNNGECGLSDDSAEGAWRLPNRRELLSLIDDGQYNPALPSGHPFTGVQSYRYWTSTTYAGNTSVAWLVDLLYGYVYYDVKALSYYVWPVRGPDSGGAPAPTCSDGTKNGDEVDVDCGGSCPACGTGKMCTVGSGCQSGICSGGVCMAPACNDTIWNGSETDVDCGGGTCAACATGKMCSAGSDCLSFVCQSGTCSAPTCTDGVKNGTETDVDCGGSCGACGTGKICSIASDCLSFVCQGGTCRAASCSDGITNGTETDTDCGGSCAAKCADTRACNVGNDCQSGVCQNNICRVPSCTDGVRNGTETDVDCGGGTCVACGLFKSCLQNSDCASAPNASGACSGGICNISCNANYRDCDASPFNGCEINITSDTHNCGGCGVVCSAGTPYCKASACSSTP